jgi:uncharacterized protein YndB with AHSA1/START domain
MHTYEESVVIDAPRKEVWAHLVNPDSMLIWFTGLIELDADWGTEPSTGDRARAVGKILGRKLEVTLEVTEASLAESFEIKIVEGPFPVEARYTLEDSNGGTRLIEHGQSPGFQGFFGKLTDPFVIRALRNDARNEQANLKLLVEEG